jgi:hypothetical protein
VEKGIKGMKLQQLSLFLENRAGRLVGPLRALGAEGINILTLTVAGTADFGILRLIVPDADEARKVLEREGWVVNVTEVVAVDIADRPGGLAEVLTELEVAQLRIEYMYAFSLRRDDKAILIFSFEEPDRAIQVLTDVGFSVIDGEELTRLKV